MNSKLFILTIIFSSVLCFCVFAQSEDNNKNEEKEIKVLSYNLRFGELASLEELASFINEQNPDLVALQEVDFRTYRERAPHQNDKDFSTTLGYLTKMFPVYGKTIPYRNGLYGIAILSKYPLSKVERIYLPKTEHGKEQRAVLIADVEYEENKFITFASTHLDYTNTFERRVQVQKLNEIFLSNQYPIILAGDFNATPDSEEIESGMSDWIIASDLNPTIPADAPKKVIDYIFCYPAKKWSIKYNKTYPIDLSDHLPISATIIMK